MEERNELSDIVLEKDDNKSMKVKRILIIFALLIVVFLVVLVVMKTVNKPSEQNNTSKLILPPNPVSSKIVKEEAEDELFKQVPIEEESKTESFEDMVKSLKAKEIEKEVEKKNQQIVEVPIIEETPLPKPKKVVRSKPKVKHVTKPTPKKVVNKSVDSDNGSLATKGSYIQVGAISRTTPSKKFLTKLIKNNYNYRLLPITVKNSKVTKILIGPFSGYSKAKAELSGVKSSINKDAFIYSVK